jgi:hypothetical protein
MNRIYINHSDIAKTKYETWYFIFKDSDELKDKPEEEEEDEENDLRRQKSSHSSHNMTYLKLKELSAQYNE